MDIKDFFTITCVLFTCVWQSSVSVPVCCEISNFQGKSHVICSGCRLLFIPKNLPTNTKVLDLSNNNLTSLEQNSFPDLPLLTILYLQRNNLVRITSGAFDNFSNIQELDLTDNKLEQLSMDRNVFETLKKLNTLKIQRNNFHINKIYPEQALSTISNLEYLSIDIFNGFLFGKWIINQTNLRKLHLSSRGIGSVSLLNSSFDGLTTSNVKELIIIAPFRKIQTNFLSPFGDLTTLTLRSTSTGVNIHDALRGLYGIKGRTMDSLKIHRFRYKYTKGVDLRKSDMFNLGTICARKIHLIANAISTMGTDAVTAWTTKTCIEELDLSENMFYLPQSLPLFVLFRSLVHLSAKHSQLKVIGKRSILLAEGIVFLPKNLTSIDISYSGLSGPIPNLTIETNSLKVLNVGYSVQHPRCAYVFIKGLVHLEELDMSGVDCSEVHPNAFSEIPNLSRLTARKCRLESILGSNVPAIFKGLNNLSFVDISSNKLQNLHSQLFANQKDSLKYLNLSRNLLDHIPTQLLDTLTVLENIDISDNLLGTLTYQQYILLEEINARSNEFQIVLHGNPLVCSCENLEFLMWIEATTVIYKKETLSCITTEGIQVTMGDFLETFDLFKDKCVSQTWLIVSVSAMVIFFVLGILTREAWRRSVWLRVMCRHPVESTEYTNDIYISYCDKDHCWVRDTIAPWLDEKQIEYCCEDKTFIPGKYIADNIMDAIDSSRQTVFVVSYASLEREWTTFTMRLTYEYSFRDERENMNIIILLDDIKRSEFPKLIRKKWDIFRPLNWPNDSNTTLEKMAKAKSRFWDRLAKRIQRIKDVVMSTSVSESVL